MSDRLSPWEDVQRITDEVELQIHLAGMDARDRWHALQLRLAKLDQTITRSSDKAGGLVTHELADIRAALVHLRNELLTRAHGDYTTGW